MSAEALRNKFEAASKSSAKVARQETSDIIHRSQKVVNEVQIQELNELMHFLAEDVFKDKKAQYYLLIDDLDKGWVHDALRFKLIRALIETIKKFRRITNVKIVISLRADLLHMVLNQTEGKGFQTEKFQDLMMRIRWSKSDLKSLIEERLNYVFRDQYTGKKVKFDDVFTSKIGDVDPLSYMLDRSFYRPRDFIAFVNQCFEESEPGASSISARIVRQAEKQYSNDRFTAIADEWRESHGDLEMVIDSLGKLGARFDLSDLTDDLLQDFCLDIASNPQHLSGSIATICRGIANSDNPVYGRLRFMYLEVLYIVGAVGIKRNSGSKFEWSYKDEPVLNNSALTFDAKFAVHPVLHRHLNLKADGSTFNS